MYDAWKQLMKKLKDNSKIVLLKICNLGFSLLLLAARAAHSCFRHAADWPIKSGNSFPTHISNMLCEPAVLCELEICEQAQEADAC